MGTVLKYELKHIQERLKHVMLPVYESNNRHHDSGLLIYLSVRHAQGTGAYPEREGLTMFSETRLTGKFSSKNNLLNY